MSSGEPVSVVIPVFRDGTRAVAAVTAILQQDLPPDYVLDVVVVDDGSTDDTPERLATCVDSRLRVLTLPDNRGRSGARNAGVAAALGDLVVFMDCDCIPAAGYLTAHIAALSRGAVASTGHVAGNGRGFWNRYQQEASVRRSRQHGTGMLYAGSSQNLAVRRSTFDAAGGFDTGYRRYGFEDRDLLLRLAELGEIAWASSAVVSHQDALSLSLVATKMAEAGEHSSQRFLERHPAAYVNLGYAIIDCRVRPWPALMAKLLAPVASTVAAGFDAMRCEKWLPYTLAKWVVKTTGAAAYLAGTARAR